TAGEGSRYLRRPRTLRSDPREEKHLLRAQAPRLADRARVRRADHEADAREPALTEKLFAPLARERRDVVPDDLAVAQLQVLHVCAAGVRRLRDDKHAGAVTLARVQE